MSWWQEYKEKRRIKAEERQKVWRRRQNFDNLYGRARLVAIELGTYSHGEYIYEDDDLHITYDAWSNYPDMSIIWKSHDNTEVYDTYGETHHRVVDYGTDKLLREYWTPNVETKKRQGEWLDHFAVLYDRASEKKQEYDKEHFGDVE